MRASSFACLAAAVVAWMLQTTSVKAEETAETKPASDDKAEGAAEEGKGDKGAAVQSGKVEEPEGGRKADSPVQIAAGAKGFAGGNLFSTPSDTPAGNDGLGFMGNAGGFGWGAGAYVEARFVKYVGLELDLLYDSSTLLRNVTYNNVVKIREKVDTKSIRIPILLKGFLPVPFGKLAVFVGPEFVRPSSASPSNEVTGGAQYLTNKEQVENGIQASTKASTMLTMGVGLALELPANLELPIELRASKNLSQDSDWASRVDAPNLPVLFPYTVAGQNTWDFRLGVGLGYRF